MKEQRVVEKKRETWYEDHVKHEKRRDVRRVGRNIKNVIGVKPTQLKGIDLIGF